MAQPAPDAPIGDLALRVISALVLAPVVIAATWFGAPWFEILISVMMAVAGWEWCRLTGVSSLLVWTLIVGCGPAAALVTLVGGAGAALTVAAGCVVAAAVAAAVRAPGMAWHAGAGVAYLAVPAISVVWLRADSGAWAVLWLFLVIWATDSAAYFAGRAIGGPRLAPRLSPNKTWSGLAGGVGAAAAVGVAVGSLVSTVSPITLAAMGGLLGVVGQIGDLLESALKRMFHAKDTSQVIPGHGGVLDRIDGLVSAAPVLAVAIYAWRETGGALWQ